MVDKAHQTGCYTGVFLRYLINTLRPSPPALISGRTISSPFSALANPRISVGATKAEQELK